MTHFVTGRAIPTLEDSSKFIRVSRPTDKGGKFQVIWTCGTPYDFTEQTLREALEHVKLSKRHGVKIAIPTTNGKKVEVWVTSDEDGDSVLHALELNASGTQQVHTVPYREFRRMLKLSLQDYQDQYKS